MPQMQPASGDHTAPSPQVKPRYGCFSVRIGATIDHKLEQNLTLPSGRVLKKGQKVHLTVQDTTRLEPAQQDKVRYVCRHPDCARDEEGRLKSWSSKRQLLAAHPDNRSLAQVEETHMFVGVVDVPAVEGRPEKKDKQGVVVEERVEPRAATVVLVSDEE